MHGAQERLLVGDGGGESSEAVEMQQHVSRDAELDGEASSRGGSLWNFIRGRRVFAWTVVVVVLGIALGIGISKRTRAQAPPTPSHPPSSPTPKRPSLVSHNPLGPGQTHPWPLTPAAAVGLSAAQLQLAGDAVGKQGAPLCLAIVKDGALVLDRTYGLGARPVPPSKAAPYASGGGARMIETMSAGKTITAALMGAAITAGLFDLDTPLVKYGVKPLGANWAQPVNYFPNITARHLLTQSTGKV